MPWMSAPKYKLIIIGVKEIKILLSTTQGRKCRRVYLLRNVTRALVTQLMLSPDGECAQGTWTMRHSLCQTQPAANTSSARQAESPPATEREREDLA